MISKFLRVMVLAVFILECICERNIYELKKDNQSNVISVEVGVDFKVAIAGNPTTGYEWSVDSESTSINPKFELIDSKYEGNKFEPGMVGVGGVYIFSFIAKEEGDFSIKFIYKQLKVCLT